MGGVVSYANAVCNTPVQERKPKRRAHPYFAPNRREYIAALVSRTTLIISG